MHLRVLTQGLFSRLQRSPAPRMSFSPWLGGGASTHQDAEGRIDRIGQTRAIAA
jgi:hypothetical protein